MITANENDLVEPMVLVPLSDYEDGIVARTKLMLLTDFVEKSEYINKRDLMILLGLEVEVGK